MRKLRVDESRQYLAGLPLSSHPSHGTALRLARGEDTSAAVACPRDGLHASMLEKHGRRRVQQKYFVGEHSQLSDNMDRVMRRRDERETRRLRHDQNMGLSPRGAYKDAGDTEGGTWNGDVPVGVSVGVDVDVEVDAGAGAGANAVTGSSEGMISSQDGALAEEAGRVRGRTRTTCIGLPPIDLGELADGTDWAGPRSATGSGGVGLSPRSGGVGVGGGGSSSRSVRAVRGLGMQPMPLRRTRPPLHTVRGIGDFSGPLADDGPSGRARSGGDSPQKTSSAVRVAPWYAGVLQLELEAGPIPHNARFNGRPRPQLVDPVYRASCRELESVMKAVSERESVNSLKVRLKEDTDRLKGVHRRGGRGVRCGRGGRGVRVEEVAAVSSGAPGVESSHTAPGEVVSSASMDVVSQNKYEPGGSGAGGRGGRPAAAVIPRGSVVSAEELQSRFSFSSRQPLLELQRMEEDAFLPLEVFDVVSEGQLSQSEQMLVTGVNPEDGSGLHEWGKEVELHRARRHGGAVSVLHDVSVKAKSRYYMKEGEYVWHSCSVIGYDSGSGLFHIQWVELDDEFRSDRSGARAAAAVSADVVKARVVAAEIAASSARQAERLAAQGNPMSPRREVTFSGGWNRGSVRARVQRSAPMRKWVSRFNLRFDDEETGKLVSRMKIAQWIRTEQERYVRLGYFLDSIPTTQDDLLERVQVDRLAYSAMGLLIPPQKLTRELLMRQRLYVDACGTLNNKPYHGVLDPALDNFFEGRRRLLSVAVPPRDDHSTLTGRVHPVMLLMTVKHFEATHIPVNISWLDLYNEDALSHVPLSIYQHVAEVHVP